jgi:GAF domain-containing protein/tRNA A-37 threonylcarbamoyl transferase component Bud32
VSPLDDSDLPPVLSERYRVRDVLGRGARSIVYRADDVLLGREVAVKVFRAAATSMDELAAQETEAKLIASLNHHALTTLFDAGATTEDGVAKLFLVMELIPGSDLKVRLARGVLAAPQVGWLGMDLAEGLAFLHSTGYLHRDIKPANVLLASREEDGRLRGKLTDFGIASLVGSKNPDGEYVTGTAAYLAPEQVEGEDPRPASDVYALGLVLLEALSGQVAYPGAIEESAFARLDRDPLIPDGVEHALATLLRDMTARDPAARPAARVVAARFQDLVVDDLVRSRALPAPEHRREVERVAALHRYRVVDQPSDPALDRVTRLAVQLLQVPYAAVSFVDADRVWMRSAQGFEVEPLDRDAAACVLRPQPGAWTVPDMREDESTAELEMVRAPGGPRSYAAAPFITHDGHSLGGICVFDDAVRTFTRPELDALTDLAGIVMHDLELRLASRRALFDR